MNPSLQVFSPVEAAVNGVESKHIRGAGTLKIWEVSVGQVEVCQSQRTHAIFRDGGIKIISIHKCDARTTESINITELRTTESNMTELRFIKAGHDPNGIKSKMMFVGTHKDKIKNTKLGK